MELWLLKSNTKLPSVALGLKGRAIMQARNNYQAIHKQDFIQVVIQKNKGPAMKNNFLKWTLGLRIFYWDIADTSDVRQFCIWSLQQQENI